MLAPQRSPPQIFGIIKFWPKVVLSENAQIWLIFGRYWADKRIENQAQQKDKKLGIFS